MGRVGGGVRYVSMIMWIMRMETGSMHEVCTVFENLEVGTEMRMNEIARFESRRGGLKLRRAEYIHQIFDESLQI